MDLQQSLFLFVGAVILMIICPALMVFLTITFDSIKPRLSFDLSKIVSPIVDLVFIPALLVGRICDIPLNLFIIESEKEQNAYWQDVYNKAGY
jgi:hypothetical protein